jgi:hypothetical protein
MIDTKIGNIEGSFKWFGCVMKGGDQGNCAKIKESEMMTHNSGNVCK